MPTQYATINYYENITDATNEANVLTAGANTGVLQTVAADVTKNAALQKARAKREAAIAKAKAEADKK